MEQRWTCPRGHHGELAADAMLAACPVCGAALSGVPLQGTLLTQVQASAASDLHATLPSEAPVWTEGSERPRVPGYELLGELGRGGMGVVYKALQLRLNRVVALKMVLSGAHAEPEELQRFRLEAEAVAQLQHPHFVQIHDVGEAEGRAYLSLEFIDGGTLAERLLSGRPIPDEAARLVATLARAMHTAHQRGIIHRDLKPANILLAVSDASQKRSSPQRFCEASLNEAVPKISDFGLAKRYTDSSGPTASQAIMGTPSYMAPEQAAGKRQDIGPAADIYALGAILYECLTGRPPFAAETPLDTVLQLTTEEPLPPRRLAPRCPRPLETICLKCLEKQPKNRYVSAMALAEDLERYLAGEPVLARPVGPVGRLFRWCRRQPAFAATVIGLGLFYVNHLVVTFVLNVEGSRGEYHWFVTAVLAVWMAVAWGFQQVVRRPRWEQVGTIAWACANVCFFTLLLWRGNGPQSSLLAGYLLMTASAALHGRVVLVWAVTALGIVGYLALAVHALVQRPEVAVRPYQSFIFVLFLAMMGLLLHLLLRRTRPTA